MKTDLSKYIGSRIKLFRLQKKLTQEELAKLVNTTKATISNYETGYRTPQQDMLFELANTLNVQIDHFFPEKNTIESIISRTSELMTELEPPRQEKVYSFAEKQLEEQKEENKIVPLYPVITVEKLCAGNGYTYNEVNETETYYTDRDDLPRYDLATVVTGDSMVPDFEDGEVVLIASGYDGVQGSVYAVDYNGEAYIKKVFLDGGYVTLSSINSEYDDIEIALKEAEDFNIVGKVIDSFEPISVSE